MFNARGNSHDDIFPLTQVNEALAAMDNRIGGFTNFIVEPTRAD